MSPGNFMARDPEGAVQLAARFMALIRTGRSYSVQHAGFRTQLGNWHAGLEAVLGHGDSLRLESHDGDLFWNDERFPYRPNLQRLIEQLALEIAARTLAGIEFAPGLTVDELERFMTLFIAGERWKGAELVAECLRTGTGRARPVLEAKAKPEPAGGVLTPGQLGAARGAWMAFLATARRLLSGEALDQGIELRHVKRATQPLVDAVLAGEAVLAMLAAIAPGEPDWAHASHTALVGIAIGVRLGVTRRDLSDLAIAALLHDVGHHGPAGCTGDRPHTDLGARRIAWATTLNRSSLDAMRAALEHHAALPEQEPADDAGGSSRLSQIVAVADAYVTLLSSAQASSASLWPAAALARVLEVLRPGNHVALAAALVRALGCHPPGQMVELDDGFIANVVMPGAADPGRPWVQLVADRRGRLLRTSQPIAILAPGRSIARALPREEWPIDDPPRLAA